jgi:hypothetical protein
MPILLKIRASRTNHALMVTLSVVYVLHNTNVFSEGFPNYIHMYVLVQQFWILITEMQTYNAYTSKILNDNCL